ncbi:voltage-gated potassium channel [Methanomicrobium sp. W14]|uniref:ion transporter n=1 Tax=Methanomicrobium sp. W14 TaxID=2817839 RepID=UPI001AE5043C|nr:ion transporter [Methanomicrobium sp. W14]MBP2133279.1 voltage-gated potassium channel [Methanomicrobium sp. W14]
MASSGKKSGIKARVHDVLESPPENDKFSLNVHIALAFVIVLNTVFVVIYTVPSIAEKYWILINVVIYLCLLVFAAEYILRMWSCTDAPTFKRRTLERLHYATGFYMIIDLVSIIPLFFPFIFAKDFTLLRIFRLLSIFKLGRYTRHADSLRLLKRVFIEKREIFSIMVFFLVFVILFSSTIMYLVENPAQPDKFSSIPASMWWGINAVTTVGYGDVVPVTALGKFLACFITLAGVLILALPSAILATGFIEEKQKDMNLESSRSPENIVEILERLSKLKEKGDITEEEFEGIKKSAIKKYKSVLEDDSSKKHGN